MKKILVLCICLVGIFIKVQGQCSDEILLTTQAEVDAFPQNYGCTNIEGNLTIGLQTAWNNIYSLDSLYQIETISGGFGIYANVVLKDLSGLENLESIGTYFGMRHCNALINFTGLDNLNSIGGEANIGLNDSLVNLVGLENLEYSGGIILQYNPFLESLAGLNNLVTLEGLTLFENENLTSASGLSTAISTTNYFSITENDMLTDLSNVEALEHVEYYFTIDGNDSLSNLSAFKNLSTVGGGVRIHNNQTLTDISDLNNLTSLEEFALTNNPNLSVCCVVLDFVEEVEGEITIANNDTTCNSIEAITGFCTDATVLNDQTLLKLQQTIYPNPNKGTFYLKSNVVPILSIKIHNSLGQVVFEQKQSRDILQIDLSQQSKGLYFVSIETLEGILIEKILVQ